jgi:putative transferase (TIGR04331 family)
VNIPKDMFEFALCMGTDKWNHYLFSEICKLFLTNERIFYLNLQHNAEQNKDLHLQPTVTFKGKIAGTILRLVKKTTTRFTRNNKYFISSSYMGLREEVFLNFRLKQLPTLYEFSFPSKSKPDINLRRVVTFDYASESLFERFFASMISKQIPVCFLEGYKQMIKEALALSFPRSPKLIFTSNFLAFDSLAMAYTAENIDRGAKLVHGQHGGYGIPAFMSAFDHEKNISDRFISWGMIQEKMENMVTVGILKPIKQYKIKGSPNRNNTLLLIRGLWPRYTFRLDSGSGLNLNDTIDNCLQFANLLNKKLRNGPLLVRLYPADHGFGEEDRWRDRFPEIRLDSRSSIAKLVSSSRLVIYTYNIGTGYLEYLCANVPTIAFWNMNTSPVSEIAAPYFEELKHVGVFHDTPESLAAHVCSVWDDVESWWQSASVQNSIKKFCERFAYVPDNLVEQVELVLRNEIKIN